MEHIKYLKLNYEKKFKVSLRLLQCHKGLLSLRGNSLWLFHLYKSNSVTASVCLIKPDGKLTREIQMEVDLVYRPHIHFITKTTDRE